MAGTGGRKAPSEPGFHPSRDVAHHLGDETSTGQQVLLDQGEIPSRLEMFGAQGKGDLPKRNYSRLRPLDPTASKHIAELGTSKIPTQHFAGDNRSNGILVQGEGLARNDPGHYRPETPQDFPLVSAGPASRADATMIHELGHARHYDIVTKKVARDHLTKSYRDARGFAPDPLREAVADAYVDRYGGRLSAAKTAGDYSHISNPQFGYSSEYEVERGANAVWDSTDRAIYAGTRAHFGETGDIPEYQSRMNPRAVERGQYLRSGVEEKVPSDPISDATIHHLSKSPHAREAWSQITTGGLRQPLSEVAEQASRRHQDRRLLNEGQFTQGSMFLEMKTESGEHKGFVPAPDLHPEGWSEGMKALDAFDTHTDLAWPHTLEHNQFGEEPRSSSDIQGSLGLSRSDVKQYKEPTVGHLPDLHKAVYRSNRKDFD